MRLDKTLENPCFKELNTRALITSADVTIALYFFPGPANTFALTHQISIYKQSKKQSMYTHIHLSHPNPLAPSHHSPPHLTPQQRRKHNHRLPKNPHPKHHTPGPLPPWALSQHNPHRQHRDGKEVIHENDGPPDNASEETDGAGDAGAAALEVAEAAELERSEVGI